MRRTAAVVAALAMLAGCSSDRPEPVEDATRLEQNIPTEVDGVRVIAYNMGDDSGIVDVDGDPSEVSVGDSLEVGEIEYEVVQIVEDSDDEGPDGWISIREQ
ncbi:MAG: hypothetical protein ACTMHL_15105 [Janibacter sp.]